jgi:hypothetical protein
MFLSLQKDNRIKNSATKCLEIGYIYDVNFDKCFHPKSMIGIPQ